MANEIIAWFRGGPWDNQIIALTSVPAPVYAVADDIGKQYWLDINSDPPVYHWFGNG
jgi:hypothetical protein